MRLGLYPCKLTDGAKVRSIYGEELIYERHRHRFELNNAFRRQLTESGLQLAGISPDGKLVEIVELPSHPWFIGVQFHPEQAAQAVYLIYRSSFAAEAEDRS